MLDCLNLAVKFNLQPFKLGIAGEQYAVLGGSNPLKPVFYTFNDNGVTQEQHFSSLHEGLGFFARNAIEFN